MKCKVMSQNLEQKNLEKKNLEDKKSRKNIKKFQSIESVLFHKEKIYNKYKTKEQMFRMKYIHFLVATNSERPSRYSVRSISSSSKRVRRVSICFCISTVFLAFVFWLPALVLRSCCWKMISSFLRHSMNAQMFG